MLFSVFISDYDREFHMLFFLENLALKFHGLTVDGNPQEFCRHCFYLLLVRLYYESLLLFFSTSLLTLLHNILVNPHCFTGDWMK